MGDEPHDAESREDELQFERAEYADANETETGAATCSNCGGALAGWYCEVNAAVVCPRCAEETRSAMTGGSGFGRFARATVYGVLAAAAGSAVWYGIRAATGYEIGLVAILVGLLVGVAVKSGSAGRGGWFYQILAVILTYCSVAATWLPEAIQYYREKPAAELATATSEPVEEGASEPVTGAEDPNLALGIPSWDELGTAGRIVAVTVLYVFCLVVLLPAMIGSGDIIGLLIVGFAFYEAWKLNKRAALQIAGPFAITASDQEATASPSNHHGSQ
jgi:hypothetical protein